eukprot:TRINITY_DN23173_c1_g2_i3.p1 TRINITY_DN23173_c1_g2~~TRINITY_DN23173_c1_g2_i3.p1  ORF type:complete len:2177 (+),score=473.46 TRINITY_DN23173_c1_g2_i3:147-6677(+)
MHQDDGEYVLWKPETLPVDAAYTAFINTAPRIIFSLYPPLIRYAKFSPTGTKIFVAFDSGTLQGAIPQDTNGDEVPDYFNPEDKIERGPCELFLDEFTMKLLSPGAMCQWTSDSEFFIEISLSATIAPGDLVRIRAGRVYAGKKSPGGVYQFSQPSTDFGILEVPDEISAPIVHITANEYIDTCTELYLDGTSSRNHGYRGTFEWILNRTEPETSEPHIRELSRITSYGQPATQSKQIVRIPPKTMQGNVTYYYTLKVTSFWDPSLVTTKTKKIVVSLDPVPPLMIYGAKERDVQVDHYITAISYLQLNGGCLQEKNPQVSYNWTGCYTKDAVENEFGLTGCPQDPAWDPTIFDMPGPLNVSGIRSKSLLIEPRTLPLFQSYMFTVSVSVTMEGQDRPLRNMASVIVRTSLSPLEMKFQGGSGYSAVSGDPIVVNALASQDPSDPGNKYGSAPFYTFSCEQGTLREPCTALQTAGSDGGSVAPMRRLPSSTDGEVVRFEPDPLEPNPCARNSGETNFSFRGESYYEAVGITWPNEDPALMQMTNHKYCMTADGLLFIQRNALPPGEYRFNVNMSKTTDDGATRTISSYAVIQVKKGTVRSPLVSIQYLKQGATLPSDTLRFEGKVTNPDADTEYEYRWTAYSWASNPEYSKDLAANDKTYNVSKLAWVEVNKAELDFTDSNEVRTPGNRPYLVTTPNILNPNVLYKFRLTATDTVLQNRGYTDEADAYAEEIVFCRGLPPSGGKIISSALSGVAFDTIFELSMTGWGSEDLPITYKFGYKQDSTDENAEVVFLTSMFSEQRVLRSRLPPGLAMPSNRIQVIGYARSALGAITTVTIDLKVVPQATSGRRLVDTNTFKYVSNLEPETALVNGIMVAQSIQPSDLDWLATLLTLVEQATGIQNITRVIRGLGLPMTREVVSQTAVFYTTIADKGFKNTRLLGNVRGLMDVSIGQNFLEAEDNLSPAKIDIVRYLLTTTDAYIPGLPNGRRLLSDQAEERARFKRFGDGPGSAAIRNLQGLALEVRTKEEQYYHFQEARQIERELGNRLVQRLVPGEVPLGYLLRGHDYYVGISEGTPDERAREHDPIQQSFVLPTIYQENSSTPMEKFVYRYVQFKKFPYGYMALPDKKDLDPPPDTSLLEKKVPSQKYSLDSRYWHAMSLELSYPNGSSMQDEVEATLKKAPFSQLPKLSAYHLRNPGARIYAATCYRVADDRVNYSAAMYEPRGVVYSEDSCVTDHLSDFVVFIDNLYKDLTAVEQDSDESNAVFVEESRHVAMTSSLVLIITIAFIGSMFGTVVDDREKRAKVVPIDCKKGKVAYSEDPRKRMKETVIYTLKRCHLLGGFWVLHRKITRERRTWTVLVAFLATQALAASLHARAEIRAEQEWLATGLVCGVLVFPLVQFTLFMHENRPESKLLEAPPPMSIAPKGIPLKTQARMPPIKAPGPPPVPITVPPPMPTASLRIQLPSHLALPVVPPPPPKDAAKIIQKAPPPKRMAKPRPPPGPPPKNHLTALRGPDQVPGMLALPSSMPKLQLPALPSSQPMQQAPYGLAIPELGQLVLKSATTVDGQAPLPPPRPPSTGPRPPRGPPPISNVYFTATKDAQLRVPPLPPTASRAVPMPKLPALPKLSPLRKDGSAAPPPPPPPPPPAKPSGPMAPVAPESPRDGEQVFSSIPGSVISPGPEWSHTAMGRGQSSSPVPPASPGRSPSPRAAAKAPGRRPDVETTPGRRELFHAPKHAAPPPQGVPPPPPPPPPLRSANTGMPRPPPSPTADDMGPPGMMPPPVAMDTFDPYLHGEGVPKGGAPRNVAPSLPPLPPLSPTSEGVGGRAVVPFKLPAAVPSYDPPRQSAGVPGLLPLQLTGAPGRPPSQMPSMPKLQLPSTILSKLPGIKAHPPGMLLPPPPPPPMTATLAAAAPPPPGFEAPPPVPRKLRPVTGLHVQPKPPNAMGVTKSKATPKPPAGPPPKHALVLSGSAPQRGGAPTPPKGKAPVYLDGKPVLGINGLIDVAKLTKPPPSRPRPPSDGMPTFVHKSVVEDIAKARIEKAAPKGKWSKQEHKPIYDWVRYTSMACVWGWVFTTIFGCSLIIITFGTYMDTPTTMATWGATLVGFFINTCVFELVKCVVIAMVALVGDDTMKQQQEISARRARMRMKQQRLQRQGKWERNEAPPSGSFIPPPPLLGR